MPEELLMGLSSSKPLYRRYYYGHPSQLQVEVKQIPLHISVQSFSITPISQLLTIITNVKWDENETCATHS